MKKINVKIIMLLGLLICLHGFIHAQESLNLPVNIKSSYLKLKDLIDDLEDQTDYKFSYASTVLDDSKNVKINYECKTLREVLELISHQFQVSYHTQKSKILFYKAQKLNKDDKSVLKIKGKIKDSETNKDIPFAAIQLSNTNKGTSANADGKFEFKIEQSNLNDTLIFSCLAYENKKLAVNDFNMLQDTLIYLNPSSIEINEVVVKPVPAVEILREAIKEIPQNYPDKPVVFDAFYRTLLTQNGKYVRLAEAACSFYTAAYTDTVDHYNRQKSFFSEQEVMNKDSFIVHRNLGWFDDILAWFDCHVSEKDKVAIIDSRISKDYSRTLHKSYVAGGPMHSIASDKVRFRTDFLDTEKFRYYKYTYKGVTSYNNREVYIISFRPKKIQFRMNRKEDFRQQYYKHNFKKAELKGRIYIDSKTKAIIGLDYENKHKDKYSGDLTYNVKVDYQLNEGKWYLRQVSKTFGQDLAIDTKRKLWDHFEASTNLTVNSIDTLANFEYDSIPPMPYSRFVSMYLAAGDYHPEFWKNYNTLLISELEKKIITDLEKTKSLEEQFILSQQYDSTMVAPVAYEEPVVDTIHGDIRIDPYKWMENKDSTDVINYLIDENNYTDNYAVQFKQLKQNLVDEAMMWYTPGKIINQQKVGDYVYFEKYPDESNYSVLYRKRDTIGSKDELVLDFNELAEKHSDFYLGDYEISPDNRYVALTVDTTGLENYIVLFTDLDKREFLKDTLKNVVYIIWNNSNKNNIYYVTVDSLDRYNGLHKHNIGESQNLDKLIYKENDDRYDIHLSQDKSGRYLIINPISYINDEIQYLDMQTGKIEMLYSRNNNHFYRLKFKGDTTFVCVENDSINFISGSILDNPEDLSDTIYSVKDGYIVDYELRGSYLIIHQLKNARHELKVINLKDGEINNIKIRDNLPAYRILSEDFSDKNKFKFRVSSYNQAPETYEYNLTTGKQKIIEKSKSIDGFSGRQYKTELIFIKSADGVEIPVTVIYNDKIIKEKPGTEKFILKEYSTYINAYGCYGISKDPFFSPLLLSLLDRGVICAVAHVRGGREKGPEWFRDGNAENKINTYTDFIDCTKGLIDLGYSTSGKIGLYVASAGGVLGGYAINNNPELFRVVILDVPVCDLLSTLLKKDPRSEAHFDIYGNPHDSLDYYRIKQYSPIENIKENDYPTVLIETGYNDSRVGYWEGAKMAAYLRKNNLGENKILNRIIMNSGHSGPYGYWDRLNESAFRMAFILHELRK